MCYAVLRITYHHDKAKDLIEVSTCEEMTKRRDEFRSRPGVRKVTIFTPYMSYEETRRWEITNHVTQEKEYEEANQTDVASSQQKPSQDAPRYGQELPEEQAMDQQPE